MTRLEELRKQEAIRANRVENVRTVLVVLSGRSIVFDDATLSQKIKLTYPEAEVYFLTPMDVPLGRPLPDSQPIDLVIDFTGPGHKRKWFLARRLRSRARVCVGRNVGFFRAHIYDRLVEDSAVGSKQPGNVIEYERKVQLEVLAQAGVPVVHQGALGQNLQDRIATKYSRLAFEKASADRA